ncbi:MAG TPA: glycosyltransferase family 2 protein [Cyclobacteriaceae bacterium]|nr:glycosyltransferase family 2 protein [Cyclobacteriaceae bacterium]
MATHGGFFLYFSTILLLFGMRDLTASIVTYKNSAPILSRAIRSFLDAAPQSTLYLIDNSPDDRLRNLVDDSRVVYVFNNKNVGFGAGHNQILSKILDHSKYHIVLNPDVYFDEQVIQTLYDFMEQNNAVGQLMPKVLYPDGRLQYLCKLLPTPKILLLRRFLNILKDVVERENFQYQLQFTEYDQIMDVPFLSGCFMFLRTESLKEVGLFDERFFLYTEDTDLTRRLHSRFRTVYFPDVSIYHYHARGSYKDFRLMLHNIQSAIRYFNKWGWVNDPERERINKLTLRKYSV